MCSSEPRDANALESLTPLVAGEIVERGLIPNSRRRAWGWFGLGVTGVLLVWGVILPRFAAQPAMRAVWERWEQQGIDPSVRFYTELPVSDAVARRLEGR